MHPVRRALLLLSGCAILGTGVALILLADLGSDGFSTLVNGFRLATGLPFFVSNVIISASFLVLAATRRVLPGIGTLVQIAVVGGVASLLLGTFSIPSSLAARIALLVLSLPVIAVGVTLYLGAKLGAGPMEAAGLAFDPPVPFRWSYNTVQALSALTGWLLGATIGVATVVVIIVLGPLVDLTARLLRIDIRQRDPRSKAESAG